MQLYKCALLCALLALSILEPIAARKSYSGSRHSYPKSGGLSGGGSHGYPSSGGLSGGGRGYPSSSGSHAYPSSGGLSGNSGGHGGSYPSSGGSHSYPSSGGSQSYPSSGGKYPSSGGGHSYPSSGGGLSGNSKGPGQTTIHHHYHYSPPQSISYTPSRGMAPVSYPVYRGTPPNYVYQYKDSGSKYGTLLAGLALMNLGTIAAGTAYAVSHSNSHSSASSYTAKPGEVCKFGLKKDNGEYEETRIDCQIISSFILAEQAKTQATGQQNTTTITTTTTVTNVTMFNNTNPAEPSPGPAVNQTTKVLYEMLPNGTLVPVNIPVNVTADGSNATASTNDQMTSSVMTTTTTNTTVTNALDVKGKPVDVTPGMECFVIRVTPNTKMRKPVPCQVLQTYADKSIQKNSVSRNLPTYAMLTAVFAVLILN